MAIALQGLFIVFSKSVDLVFDELKYTFVQVLQWISEHGEAFLAKYTGIGKTLHRATQLRKRHEDFEDVAQNTYTNAEKLLEAAEQLAQSGECEPRDILQVEISKATRGAALTSAS